MAIYRTFFVYYTHGYMFFERDIKHMHNKKIIGIAGFLILALILSGIKTLCFDTFSEENVSEEYDMESTEKYKEFLSLQKIDENTISDENYYPTVEQAMKYADIALNEGEEYQKILIRS